MTDFLSVWGDAHTAANKLHFRVDGQSVGVDDAVRLVNNKLAEVEKTAARYKEALVAVCGEVEEVRRGRKACQHVIDLAEEALKE